MTRTPVRDGRASALARETRKKSRAWDEEKHPATCRMKEKLATEPRRKRYARRKGIVEPVHGWIKKVCAGFRQFSLRGLQKAAAGSTALPALLKLTDRCPPSAGGRGGRGVPRLASRNSGVQVPSLG